MEQNTQNVQIKHHIKNEERRILKQSEGIKKYEVLQDTSKNKRSNNIRGTTNIKKWRRNLEKY